MLLAGQVLVARSVLQSSDQLGVPFWSCQIELNGVRGAETIVEHLTSV